MSRLVGTKAALAVVLVGAAACGSEPPPSGVAVPGAPKATTPIVTAAPTSTTGEAPVPETAATTTTTAAPTTTSTAPPTTVAAPPSTAVAPTTVATTLPATTAPPTTAFVYTPEPAEGALRAGYEGPRSLQLQRDLIRLGILPAGADDGQFGPGTAGGVRRFQESRGLVVDGVAGPNTMAALAQALAELTPPTA